MDLFQLQWLMNAMLWAVVMGSCDVGKYAPMYSGTGNYSCHSCTSGKYQNEVGQSTCKTCALGQYQDNAGQSACKQINKELLFVDLETVSVLNSTHLLSNFRVPVVPNSTGKIIELSYSTSGVPGQLQDIQFQHCLPYVLSSNGLSTNTSIISHAISINVEIDTNVQDGQLVLRGQVSWGELSDADIMATLSHVQVTCAYASTNPGSNYTQIFSQQYSIAELMSTASRRFTLIYNLGLGFECNSNYVAECVASLELKTSVLGGRPMFTKKGVLQGDKYRYDQSRAGVFFQCSPTAFMSSQSKLNPVDPQYVLQYKNFSFSFDNQYSTEQMYVEKNQVLSTIRSLVQPNSNGVGVDNVNYWASDGGAATGLTHLEPIFIDIALDQTDNVVSSLGKRLSKFAYTNKGPVDIDAQRFPKASTVYWSAAKSAFWSAKLRPAPKYHAFDNANVYIELPDSPSGWEVHAELNELEVYLTPSFIQDRVALQPSNAGISALLQEDFETESGFTSVNRASPPSGSQAWTGFSYTLSIPNAGLNLIKSPVTKESGFTIGFWLWTQGTTVYDKGLVLVDLQNPATDTFVRIGFDRVIDNALRIQVKFSQRYERLVRTESNVLPQDQWCHVILRVGPEISQEPEPFLFVDTKQLELTLIGGITLLSSMNVEMYNDQIQSMTFWYSDGRRRYEPTSLFGDDLLVQQSVMSLTNNSQTFQIWDTDTSRTQTVSIHGESNVGNPTLSISISSDSGTLLASSSIHFVSNKGVAQVEVPVSSLITESDPTISIKIDLQLAGSSISTRVSYKLQVESGVLRSKNGEFVLNVANDEHITGINVKTSALNSSANLGARMVSNVVVESGSNGTATGIANNKWSSQSAPWFGKPNQMPHSGGEIDVAFNTTDSYFQETPSGSGIQSDISACMWIKLESINEPSAILSFQEERTGHGVTCSYVNSVRNCSITAGSRSTPNVLILAVGGTNSQNVVGSRSWSPFSTVSCPVGYSVYDAGDSSVCVPLLVNKRAAQVSNPHDKKILVRCNSLTECQISARQWNLNANGVEYEMGKVNDPRKNVRTETWSFNSDAETEECWPCGEAQCCHKLISRISENTAKCTMNHNTNKYDCQASHYIFKLVNDFEVQGTLALSEWNKISRVANTPFSETERSCKNNDPLNQYSGSCSLNFTLKSDEQVWRTVPVHLLDDNVVGTATKGSEYPFHQKELTSKFVCYALKLVNPGTKVRVQIVNSQLTVKVSHLYVRPLSGATTIDGTSRTNEREGWVYNCIELDESNQHREIRVLPTDELAAGEKVHVKIDDFIMSREDLTDSGYKYKCTGMIGMAISTVPGGFWNSHYLDSIAATQTLASPPTSIPGEVVMYSGTGSTIAVGAAPLSVKTWFHVCLVKSSTDAFITINGEKGAPVSTASYPSFTAGNYKLLVGRSLDNPWRTLSSPNDGCFGYWRTKGGTTFQGGFVDGEVDLCPNHLQCECQDWVYGMDRSQSYNPDIQNQLKAVLSRLSVYHKKLLDKDLRADCLSESYALIQQTLAPDVDWLNDYQIVGDGQMFPSDRNQMNLPFVRSYSTTQAKTCRLSKTGIADGWYSCPTSTSDTQGVMEIVSRQCTAKGRMLCDSQESTCAGFTIRWLPNLSVPQQQPTGSGFPLDNTGVTISALSVALVSVSPTKLQVSYKYNWGNQLQVRKYGASAKCFHLSSTNGPSIIHEWNTTTQPQAQPIVASSANTSNASSANTSDASTSSANTITFTYSSEQWRPGKNAIRCSIQSKISSNDVGITGWASGMQSIQQSYWNIETTFTTVPRLAMCNSIELTKSIELSRSFDGIIATGEFRQNLPSLKQRYAQSSWIDTYNNGAFKITLDQTTEVDRFRYQPICNMFALPRNMLVNFKHQNQILVSLNLNDQAQNCSWKDSVLAAAIAVDSIDVSILEYWDNSDPWYKKCQSCAAGWSTTHALHTRPSELTCVSTVQKRTNQEDRTRYELQNYTRWYMSNMTNMTNMTNITESYQKNVSIPYSVQVEYNVTVCEFSNTQVPGTLVLTGESAITLEQCQRRCENNENCYGINFSPGSADPYENNAGRPVIDNRTGTANGGDCYFFPLPTTISEYRYSAINYEISGLHEVWIHRLQYHGLTEVQILATNSKHEYGNSVQLISSTARETTYNPRVGPWSRQFTAQNGRGIVHVHAGQKGGAVPWRSVDAAWSRQASYDGYNGMTIQSGILKGKRTGLDDIHIYNVFLSMQKIANWYRSYSRNVFSSVPSNAQKCNRVTDRHGTSWKCSGALDDNTRVLIRSIGTGILGLATVKCGVSVPRLQGGSIIFSGVQLRGSGIPLLKIHYPSEPAHGQPCKKLYKRRLLSSRNQKDYGVLQRSYCADLKEITRTSWCKRGIFNNQLDIDGDGIFDEICSAWKVTFKSGPLKNPPRDNKDRPLCRGKPSKNSVADFFMRSKLRLSSTKNCQESSHQTIVNANFNWCKSNPYTYYDAHDKYHKNPRTGYKPATQHWPAVVSANKGYAVAWPTATTAHQFFHLTQQQQTKTNMLTPISERREFLAEPNTARDSKDFQFFDGPIGLTSGECVTRSWAVPQSGIDLVGARLSFNLWLLGQWPRKYRNFDLSVSVDGVEIWNLGLDAVCSSLGGWKTVTKTRFQKLTLNLLTDTTCYVPLEHRFHAAWPFSILKICRTGTFHSKTYIAVSDLQTDLTHHTTLYRDSVILLDHATTTHVLQVNPLGDATRAEYFVSIRMCNTRNRAVDCGQKNVRSSVMWAKSYFEMSVQNNQATDVEMSVQNNQIQGPLTSSVNVQWLQCAPTSLQCDSNSTNKISFPVSQYWIPGTKKTFFAPVQNSFVATKLAVKLCSQNFGCSFHLATAWNVDLKYWSKHNTIQSARFVPVQHESNNFTLDINFPSVAANETFALPTHRRVSWWSNFSSSQVEFTLGEWVGCFELNGQTQLDSFTYDSNRNTVIGCSEQCYTRGYVFAALNKHSHGPAYYRCSCGMQHPRTFAATQLVWALKCGGPDVGEDTIVPTYYLGTTSTAAVYRVATIVKRWSKNLGMQLLPISQQPVTNKTLIQCNLDYGYIMFTPQQVKDRFNIVLAGASSHLVCVYFDIARSTWHLSGGITFVPVKTDILIGTVSLTEIVLASDTKQPSLFQSSDNLFERAALMDSGDAAISRLNATFLQATGTFLKLFAYPRLYSGATLMSFGSKYQASSFLSATVELQNSMPMIDKNIGLLDTPGSLKTYVATSVCIERGEYPSLCTQTVENFATSMYNLPNVPTWNNVNITVVPAQQNVIIQWQPLLYWGKGALKKNIILAFEVEVKRVDHSCIARDNQDNCMESGFSLPGALSTQYCLIARSPKNNRLGKPQYQYTDRQTDACKDIKTDACYAHLLDTDKLPPCACSGNICSSAALSTNFRLAYEIMLGDFYANVQYVFRSRSVHYSAKNFAARSNLAHIGPKLASAWTSWSSPVTMPPGSPPNQPPHPTVRVPRITSIEFRIWRANFNGIPITHYEFQLAEDVNCDALNNLLWDKSVVVPVNNTFEPYVDFRRGDPNKGGLGDALPAGILYHYRVRAVNQLNEKGPWSNHYIDAPVRTGTVENPVAIYLDAPSTFVNHSTCFDVALATPRCRSITLAVHAFEEVVDMRYGLTPDVYFLDYPLSFNREGASVESIQSDLLSQPNVTAATTVVVDCQNHRCFKECLKPLYVTGMDTRCFGPSKLTGIIFRNALSNGPGAVLSRVPNIRFQQRRLVVVEDCIFERNTALGHGGALFFKGHTEMGGVILRNIQFIGNVAYTGGGIAIDSTKLTFENLSFTNNSAILPSKCPNDHFGPSCLPCPSFSNLTCAGNGICNDGVMGTGNCTCKSGYNGIACEHVTHSRLTPSVAANVTSDAANVTNASSTIDIHKMKIRSNKTLIDTNNDTLGLIKVVRYGNGGGFAATAFNGGSVITGSGIFFRNNSAASGGGGIFLQGTTMSVIRTSNDENQYSLILQNNKALIGGCIYVSNSIFNTTHLAAATASTINENTTLESSSMHFLIAEGTSIKDGGGVACIGSTIHFEATYLKSNAARMSGGGLYGVLCNLELVTSKIAYNAATFDGGGIYLEALSSASVLRSTLYKNAALGNGGSLYSKYCRALNIGRTLISNNSAAQGGGMYIEDSWEIILIENSIITFNIARDGGGGGIMWVRTPPEQMGHVILADNIAQYGNNIASGIGQLITDLGSLIEATNTDPADPEIRVSIIDSYGNIVRRRNQATTVVATVFSNYCMYRQMICRGEKKEGTGIPDCTNCPTVAQSLFGRPAREIPGLVGSVNFTGLGFRAWPGNHTLRLEVDRIKPVFRKIAVSDCLPGQFLLIKEGVDGGTCALCPSGFHKNSSGIQACKGCNSGFACVAGTIEPVPCARGRFSVSRSPRCSDCALGQYQPRSKKGSCIGCTAGRFTNVSAMSHCFDCQPGLAAETDFATECVICNVGRFSKEIRSTGCTDCPRGFASQGNSTQGISCPPCAAGFYSELAGSQACLKCAAGKRTFLAGMWECGECPPGTASGDEKSTTCQTCQKGRYAKGFANDACTICPSGWHASGDTNTQCQICSAGTACLPGASHPEICNPGWYSPRDQSNDCLACTIGTASTQKKSSSCETCQPGMFAVAMSSTGCSKCPLGQFVAESRSAACRACPRGWAASTIGSPECTKCPVRWRSSNRIDPGAGSGACVKCLLGEVQPPDSGECHYCTPGTFSLHAGEQLLVATYVSQKDNPDIGKVFPIGATKWASCHPCPIGGVCGGGHRLKAKNGYWRSSNKSTQFTICFHPQACEGAAREKEDKRTFLQVERNETCAVGFVGRLCHACGAGFGRENFDSCKKCPEKTTNMALTIIGSLFVVSILIGFIIYSIQSSADEASISSMMFKTLAAYGQVIGIASLFPYKWPPEILRYFEFMDAITSVSDRILNTDCALEDRRGKGLAIVYEKAILYMMAPPIFVVCTIAVLLLSHVLINLDNGVGLKLRARFLKKGESWTRADTRRCIIVAAIVAMVILHPTLVRQAMFLLMCVNVEGKFYLRKDLQLQCHTAEHDLMTIFVAIPGILLYVLGWPMLVYRVLSRRKHKLHLKGLSGQSTRATYGFLYRGYSKNRFYWEIVIMLRKTAMVMVATFGLRCTVPTQGLLALFVISTALAAHLKLRPLSNHILEKLEFYGLSAAFITLYFGMFFFTDDVVFAPWWGFIVTFTIMFINSLFMFVFCLYLYGAFKEESGFVKRLNTSFSIKCYACMSRWGDRCCCCYLWYINRRNERNEEKLNIKFRAARHKGLHDLWGGAHDRKAAKKRHKERLRRIKLNRDAGEDRGLQMVAMPLANVFAHRQDVLARNNETFNKSMVMRKKKSASMQEIVLGISDRDGSADDLSEAAKQHFGAADVDKRKKSAFASTLWAKHKFLNRSASLKTRKRKENQKKKSKESAELADMHGSSSLVEIHAMLLRVSDKLSGPSTRKSSDNQDYCPSLQDVFTVAQSIESTIVNQSSPTIPKKTSGSFGLSESGSFETNPLVSAMMPTLSKPRKSFHFDKPNQRYYSYNEETKETKWEDKPTSSLSSGSTSSSSSDSSDSSDLSDSSDPFEKAPNAHFLSALFASKLKSKVAKNKNKNKNNRMLWEATPEEVPLSVIASKIKFQLLSKHKHFKRVVAAKGQKSKNNTYTDESSFDYCMEKDGTIVWLEGPFDSRTGERLVCHPKTGQMFRMRDLDEYGGLLSTATPIRQENDVLRLNMKNTNPMYKSTRKKRGRTAKQRKNKIQKRKEDAPFEGITNESNTDTDTGIKEKNHIEIDTCEKSGRRYSYNHSNGISKWLAEENDTYEVHIDEETGMKYSTNMQTGESTWLEEESM